MSHSCFIYSSADGHLVCLSILVIINNAAMNIGMLMFLWISVWVPSISWRLNSTAINTGMLMFFQISVLEFFGIVPRNGIAGSKGRSTFNFLRYLHITFHSGCTNLHSHQQRKRIPHSPHPWQHLFYYGSHSDKCKMISSYGFNLHFSED